MKSTLILIVLSLNILYSQPIENYGCIIHLAYDVLGKEIATLVNEEKEGGFYSINFDASKYASGVYAYHFSQTDKELQ